MIILFLTALLLGLLLTILAFFNKENILIQFINSGTWTTISLGFFIASLYQGDYLFTILYAILCIGNAILAYRYSKGLGEKNA